MTLGSEARRLMQAIAAQRACHQSCLQHQTHPLHPGGGYCRLHARLANTKTLAVYRSLGQSRAALHQFLYRNSASPLLVVVLSEARLDGARVQLARVPGLWRLRAAVHTHGGRAFDIIFEQLRAPLARPRPRASSPPRGVAHQAEAVILLRT